MTQYLAAVMLTVATVLLGIATSEPHYLDAAMFLGASALWVVVGLMLLLVALPRRRR